MDFSELDIGQLSRCARAAASRWPLAAGLAAAAIGLAACGGSSTTKTVTVSAQTVAAATTTSTASDPVTPHKSKSKPAAKRHITVAPSKPKPAATSTPTTATKTTIAANPAAPAYTGPSPVACLRAAGLNRARAAVEPQVWEANSASTPESDSNGIVFLSGPYKNTSVAKNYAKSLLVVELAASGGRWVASASVPSHLHAAVDKAAACMARSSSS